MKALASVKFAWILFSGYSGRIFGPKNLKKRGEKIWGEKE